MEGTKNSYEKLLRKFESNADKVLSLPTLKSVIKEIESNGGGEPVYQGKKLKYYSTEIQFLENHGSEIIESILSCYAERYCNRYSETTTDNPISDGDTVLFDVCHVLNTTVWPQLNDSNKDEEVLSVQFTAINSIFERFKLMPVFESVMCELLQSGYADIIRYAHRYFAVDKIKKQRPNFKISGLESDYTATDGSSDQED